jgi:uncharacterized protein YcbK (DUF882 family)
MIRPMVRVPPRGAAFNPRRRALLASLGAACACTALADEPRATAQRWLELRSTHTGEVAAVPYRAEQGFVADAVARLRWLLRDHRANEAHDIDLGLFDQLADLADAAGADPRFEVISCYRAPLTNAALAAAGRGVARHSLHMEGRAIDVRLVGVRCAQLRDLALAARRGGVGYYSASDFVHIDTGRVRAWVG